jgi:signal peptidase I
VLTRAVRGRSGRGTDWGEALLRELDEIDGGWESVRWAASGLRVARRDRLRHLPASRPLGGLPPVARGAARGLAAGLVGAALLVLVHQFVLGLGYQPSGGMAPTLHVGERYLVDRVAFRLTGLDAGDVIVVASADLTDGHEVVRRVIGLPGDVVSCVDGRVLRNGTPVAEHYLSAGTTTACDPVAVGSDQLYLLGDDRDVALDSRHLGTFARSDVVGHVLW